MSGIASRNTLPRLYFDANLERSNGLFTFCESDCGLDRQIRHNAPVCNVGAFVQELNSTRIAVLGLDYVEPLRAIAHKQFQSLDNPSLVNPVHAVFDAKRFLPREFVTERL